VDEKRQPFSYSPSLCTHFSEVEKQWANRTMEATKREAERKRYVVAMGPYLSGFPVRILPPETILAPRDHTLTVGYF
jgi:hypothetical protein